jgi:hypothetical protein
VVRMEHTARPLTEGAVLGKRLAKMGARVEDGEIKWEHVSSRASIYTGKDSALQG